MQFAVAGPSAGVANGVANTHAAASPVAFAASAGAALAKAQVMSTMPVVVSARTQEVDSTSVAVALLPGA